MKSHSGLPSVADPEVDEHEVTSHTLAAPSSGTEPHTARRPYLVCIAGALVGRTFPVAPDGLDIGRSPQARLTVPDTCVSRLHARVFIEDDELLIEDCGSANGTQVNGLQIASSLVLREGDRIKIGETLLKVSYQDAIEENYQMLLDEAVSTSGLHRPVAALNWSPESWTKKPVAQAVVYPDPAELAAAVERLRALPPLVTSWEVESLKALIAEAQQGKRFLLQGGDCAETLQDCAPSIVTNKLKILIQMSLVLIHGAHRPVIRVGRFAGQYAKPRSKPTETRDGVELPSYFGDLVNRPAFTPEARTPDPNLLLNGYYHAGLTLNFVRALSRGDFGDLRKSEYYDLSFFERAELPERMRTRYQQMCREITEGLHLLRSVGADAVSDLMSVEFYASHEALNLWYESAQTRQVPRRKSYYDLSTHLPWIGERTRALDGAHVEFFRGLANPVAVKLGPTSVPSEVVELCRVLNPANEPGKLVLITRMGAEKVGHALSPIIEEVARARRKVLWVCDPMHGNAITTHSGVKTRNFDSILQEVEQSIEVHRRLGTYFGGVHFELTGEDVTECVGGGLTEADLDRAYTTACDPRLNYRQSIEMAFCIASSLSASRAHSDLPPATKELPVLPSFRRY